MLHKHTAVGRQGKLAGNVYKLLQLQILHESLQEDYSLRKKKKES